MINFFCPINTLGYGIFSYQLIRAYYEFVSPDVALIPLQVHGIKDPNINRWIENGINYSDKNPGIMLFHIDGMPQLKGTPKIGFPLFEWETFTTDEISILKGLDYILQPSAWGKSVLNKCGFDNVFIVPGGFDPKVYKPTIALNEKLKRIEKQGLTFIHVGKYESRKNSELILKAFINAASGTNAKINLLFHVYNPFDKDWFKKIKDIFSAFGFSNKEEHFTKGNSHVIVPLSPISSDEFPEIYQMADFGIWASKAEGWNLPLNEAIASGLPCITTNNTAQADFIREGTYPSELILKTNYKNPQDLEPEAYVVEIEITEKILTLIQNPEKFLNLQKRCLESVKDYTWKNASLKLGEFLKTL